MLFMEEVELLTCLHEHFEVVQMMLLQLIDYLLEH